ncbi:hypothetical protein F5B22DRAFT_512134 [Xylaria bambusicola]|uniref:uncharacterized protein n=1 Tax=Xylaria bambusicola TaxID=326684 RepID=UPI002007D333|nr:uncharacterized protein F5B22DRAFT_512134 [Xylaria bambusicola]KAI0521964.1 hypothetical protein F5B22DRAFT_512134 [Xylaria bambusicola]
MEVLGAIASFIAIGQAIAVTPKIIKTLRAFTHASEEVEALIDELESLHVFYEHMKENIDLFSSEHHTPLLQVDQPPYLKLIRKDFESLTASLQELADSYLVDENHNLKPSKLRWWKKRKNVIKLQQECYKQRQRLQDLYSLFRDRLTYKQGEMLFHIHTRISQDVGRPSQGIPVLLSPGDCLDNPPDSAEAKAIVTASETAVLDPSAGRSKEHLGRRCRCFCHDNGHKTPSYYNRQIRLPGLSYLSYHSQMAVRNQCRMNCCSATQSYVSLQLRIPIWLHGLAMLGSFTYIFPFHITLSFTPTIPLEMWFARRQLGRICHLGKPEYLNHWLSRYGLSILSTYEDGDSIIELIINYGGYPLLTYCITTWPGLMEEASSTRSAST